MSRRASTAGGALLSRTETPGQWLARRLQEREKTQRSLAFEIGYDSAQVNKWVTGRERIPEKALMLIGSSFDPSDFDAARSLLAINALVEALPQDAHRATQSSPEIGFEVAKVLATKAEETALQLASDESDRLVHLQGHLSTAFQVLVMTTQCSSQSADLIREDNVRKHLCFPFNVMMGELLTHARGREQTLGHIDTSLMKSIRRTAKVTGVRLTQSYSQQHAYHLLGRYGARHDRDFMSELVATRRDVVTRRTAHYGAIFGAEHPLAADKFIFELRHDRELQQINLDFDLVHYGDKELGSARQPSAVARTISNNLRHVSNRPRTPTTEVAFHKLISILECFGPGHFEGKRVRGQVESVLRRIQDSDSGNRTAMETNFYRVFGDLILFRPETTVQLYLPEFEIDTL